MRSAAKGDSRRGCVENEMRGRINQGKVSAGTCGKAAGGPPRVCRISASRDGQSSGNTTRRSAGLYYG
jgi:hypothetical protein